MSPLSITHKYAFNNNRCKFVLSEISDISKEGIEIFHGTAELPACPFYIPGQIPVKQEQKSRNGESEPTKSLWKAMNG
jgi:hypothetical protein